MTEVKTYLISLKSLGRITQLPDSQRLFGALVRGYSNYFSTDATTDFVKKVFDKTLNFTLSNLLPKDYLPVPHAFLSDQVTEKQAYKELKKRIFLKKEQLAELLQNPTMKTKLFPYVTFENGQQIHVSIDSLRYDAPWLKPNLYSVPETTVIEREAADSVQQMTEFQFYLTITVSLEEDNLLTTLQNNQENEEYLVLGPRSTQGLNLYGITAIKEIKPLPQAKRYLNLGMLLPNTFDFQHSYFKLHTSERRRFESNGERNKRTIKRYLSYIEAGSVIQLAPEQTDIFTIGQSIRSPFDPKGHEITFGQAFQYPLPEIGRV